MYVGIDLTSCTRVPHRYICEFCCRCICSACGKYLVTDQSLQGLWCIHNLRCSDCVAANRTGTFAFQKHMLYAMADDMNRAHCSTCRQKLLQKTLFDRAPTGGIADGGSSSGGVGNTGAACAPATKQMSPEEKAKVASAAMQAAASVVCTPPILDKVAGAAVVVAAACCTIM